MGLDNAEYMHNEDLSSTSKVNTVLVSSSNLKKS